MTKNVEMCKNSDCPTSQDPVLGQAPKVSFKIFIAGYKRI